MEAPKPIARPPTPVGAMILEAGAYTDIVSISAPNEAWAGDKVEVKVSVKNLATYSIWIAVTGKYDDSVFSFTPEYANVGAGQTNTFTGSFTMPDKGVRVYAWSFYWTGTAWYQDDEQYVDIALLKWPAADIKDISLTITEVEYPGADIKDLALSIIAIEYPAADIKDIALTVIAIEYPAADIKDISLLVSGTEPGEGKFRNLSLVLAKTK